MIPAFGLVGAAVTTLACYGVMSILLVRRARPLVAGGLDGAATFGLCAVATVVVVGLAAIPTGAYGWTVRGILLVPVSAALVSAWQALSGALRPSALVPESPASTP
jgi:hypothetical protein